MVLKTTTTPLARLTQTQWRDEFVTWLGLNSYTNDLSAAQKTDLNRYIDASHEYVDKRFGHEPWAMREQTLSLVDGTATYALRADTRTIMLITEVNTSSITRRVHVTSKKEWAGKWKGGSETHPWNVQTVPHWFLDGMDSSQPPVQQWKRQPSPDSTVAGTNNVTVYYRPYYNLLGSGEDSFTDLPANAVEAIRMHLLYKWAVRNKEWADAAQYKAAREDEIGAEAIADNKPDASEELFGIGMNEDLTTEMELLS